MRKKHRGISIRRNRGRAVCAVLLVICCLTAACGRPSEKETAAAVQAATPEPTLTEEPTPEPTPVPTAEPAETPAAVLTPAPVKSGVILTPTPEPLPGEGRTVVLDPGHSSKQKGDSVPIGPGAAEMKAGDAVGTHGAVSGLNEYDLTLQIAQKLRDELETRGYKVLLTHEDNETAVNCDERAMVANEARADCFIRIHADGSGDPAASGAMAICITPSNPWTADTYKESRRLSDCVLEAYCTATKLPSRGVLEEDNMTGNNWAVVPTTLLEMGFMTNPDEDLLMADEHFQVSMIEGIADGIDAFCAPEEGSAKEGPGQAEEETGQTEEEGSAA